MKPRGRLTLEVITGDADDTLVEARPANGEQWEIFSATLTHDDPSSRTLTWELYDGTNTVELIAADKAATVRLGLGGGWSFTNERCPDMSVPLVITYDVYLRARVSALTAGDKLYLELVVYESMEDYPA